VSSKILTALLHHNNPNGQMFLLIRFQVVSLENNIQDPSCPPEEIFIRMEESPVLTS
jgi:hypothetical protein